jgi:hypothetical protein
VPSIAGSKRANLTTRTTFQTGSERYTGLQPHPSDPHRMAARRTLVLIDIQGIVRWQWHGETTDVFPSALIVQQVQEMTAKP